MSFFRPNSCCFCINLDVGAKIIGFVCTVFAAMSATLYAVPAVLLQLPPAALMFYSSAFFTSTLQFITGCVMICGLFQKRPGLMWPWLMVSWAVGGALLLLSCAGTVLLYMDGSVRVSYVTSAYSVYALVLLYFASVVRSRRAAIVDEIMWGSGARLMRPATVEANLYV